MNSQAMLVLAKYYLSFVDYELVKIYVARTTPNVSIDHHIDAAIAWICKAQDAFKDGGVARSYSTVYHPFFKRQGWIPSYPETTGYIIPTLFEWAKQSQRADLYDRAKRMVDWECDVQMESGAVQGGTVDQPATPAIFNTGQVIFGWLRAFRETGSPIYLQSAIKAGEFLLIQQDEDGAWRKALSGFASSKMTYYAYNTRTAWGLMELSVVTGEQRFHDAAVKNIEFVLRQQFENGWFPSNCLTDSSQPLLHTIAYCIRGILETGALVKNAEYIAKAAHAADALCTRQQSDGSLAGRFNSEWQPTVTWRCLTGEAQIGGIWGRLYQITGKECYLSAMKKVNAALRRVQFLHTDHPGIYGGIGGSYPLHGNYGRFEVLNWAVKFFIDSLMLERSLTGGK